MSQLPSPARRRRDVILQFAPSPRGTLLLLRARTALGALVALALGAPVAVAQLAVVAERSAAVAAPPLASFDSAWASIARTYWDTALLQGRWRTAHDSLRAGLGEAPTSQAVRVAIRALIAVPKQSHFVLIPSEVAPRTGRSAKPPGTAGIEVRIIDRAVIAWRVAADGVARVAGMRPGDRLVQIDTVVLDSLQATLRKAAAGDTAKADNLLATFATARLGGGVDEEVLVHFVDAAGQRRAVLLERTPVEGTVTQYGNLPPFVVRASGERLPFAPGDARTIAVVRFNGWFPVLSPALDSLFFSSRDAAGLIIDLRGNPGGVIGMIAGLAGQMLDTSLSLGELKTRSGTIRFAANPRRVDPRGQRTAPFSGPVAILVDEFSASTSEFFATGMQALGRARIFGTRSAGQALPAAMGRLPSGDVLMHVIADHVDPKGRRVEGVGIDPDTRTPLLVVDVRAGKDAALDAARMWIAAGAR